MSKTHSSKLIFLLVLPFLLCGCYDRFELDNLAYVIALGADLGSGDDLIITYQIAIPVQMTGEGVSSDSAATYTTYTVSAPSLSVANTLVSNQVSKAINLSHVKLILYSEEMARLSLSGHVNVFVSQANIRPKITVAVCQGTAKEFLETVSHKLEASPSRYYELLFGSYNNTTQSEPTQLIDVYTAMQSIDRDTYMTYVTFTQKSGEEKEAEIKGIAIFKNAKLIAINEEEDFLLAHAILTNNMKQCGYSILDFQKEGKVISFCLIQNEKPKISVQTDGKTPLIHCIIQLDAHLVSSGSNINFYDKKNKMVLKENLEEKIEENITTFFQKSIEEYQADIAMIGRYAKNNFLTWDEFENYQWLSQYPHAKFQVKVNVKVNVSQIISHIVPNVE